MNTYSEKLERITRESPEYRGALDRFIPYLPKTEGVTGGVYSISRLFGILSPESLEQLKGILLSLEREGVLERILRIEPAGRVPIKDFHKLSEIPEEILDENTDELIHITPDDIKLYYRLLGL